MPKKKIAQDRTIEELTAEADHHLKMERYKEAIEAYKQLLKKENRADWQRDLATAYLERAKILADKAMYKEAAVLWENRANLCAEKSHLDLYIVWLIRGGRSSHAAHVFIQFEQMFPDDVAQQWLLLFGALLLAGQSEIATLFPEESPVRQHYPSVKAALHAYAQGDNAGAETHLQQIPFRSPYRDVRTLLKALLLLETDPQTATSLLQKIPATSPYYPLAKIVSATQLNEIALLEFLGTANRYEQKWVFCLKGWNEDLLKVIPLLRMEDAHSYSRTLFDTVIANREFFGEYGQAFCGALLPRYLEGWRKYEKTFGSLSPFAKERIHALANEHQEHFLVAERHWRKCITILKENLQANDHALQASLILHHLVELAEHNGINEKHIPDDLKDSIQLDPNNRSSYLKLIRWYQRTGKTPKNSHQWIETAVEQFPQDSEFLLLAVDAANQRKAFKRAVNFAKMILKIDPINTKARQVLLVSHLAHARKLMKSEKYDLVRKELDLAAQVERASQRSGIVQINQGLLAYKIGKRQQAHTQIQEGLRLAGNGLVALLRLTVESTLLAIPIEDLSTIIPALGKQSLAKYVPTPAEVGDLLNIVNSYHEQKIASLKLAITFLQVPLKKALSQKFSQDEMFNICQCFLQVAQYKLLREYANIALKRWEKRPAFLFYQIYSQVEGKASQLSEKQFTRLDEAVGKAKHAGDERTALMITRFLNEAAMPRFNIEKLIEEFIDEDKIEEILRRLGEAHEELPELRRPPRRKRKP